LPAFAFLRFANGNPEHHHDEGSAQANYIRRKTRGQTAGNEKRAVEFDLRKNHAFITAELSQQNSIHAHLSLRGKIPSPLLKSAERIYALPFGKKIFLI
jgi:hypothetical protein